MEPETKFRELKNRIIDEHRRIPYCNVMVNETPRNYSISCVFSNGFSYVMFDKNNLTRPHIDITFKDYQYYNSVKIPSMKLAKEYLSLLYKIRTFDDYLSLIDELMGFESEFENVQETLYATIGSILVRAITNNGDVVLKFDHWGEHGLIIRLIIITRPWKTLAIRTFKNFDEIESIDIPIGKVPKAYKSIINYAMKVSSLADFTRLNMAVSDLARLVKIEKRNISDAIKELVEARGYGDVFGYQI